LIQLRKYTLCWVLSCFRLNAGSLRLGWLALDFFDF
jgi:hypothetical protein